MSNKRTVTNGPYSVVADRSEVYPDDPGQGTPLMVYYTGHPNAEATLDCARNEGELSGSRGYRELSLRILKWLNGPAVQELEDWVFAEPEPEKVPESEPDSFDVNNDLHLYLPDRNDGQRYISTSRVGFDPVSYPDLLESLAAALRQRDRLNQVIKDTRKLLDL